MTDDELNRLVAERVMGLEIIQIDEECSSFTPGAHWAGGDCYEVSVTYTVKPGSFLAGTDDILAPYSTDIAAAWTVVERMYELGYSSEHTDLTPDSNRPWWSWHFYQFIPPPGGPHVTAQAKTPMRAICLAALRAVGVEVSDG